MENHNLILKISRLLSSSFSSCHLRTLPDVADCSVSIPKTSDSSVSRISHDENDRSSFLKKHKNPGKFNGILVSKHGSSDAEGRKCPPVTPVSVTESLKEAKRFQEWKKINLCNLQQSSSSNSGWFSSGEEKFPETDALFSLSSCSGDSIRRKAFRGTRCEEMKSIDELGERSFRSSLSSSNRVVGGVITHSAPLPAPPKITKNRRKPARKTTVKKTHHPETELGFGHIMSTHLYYDKDYVSSGRRKTTKPRRKTTQSSKNPSMIEESLAVEKKSRDPRGDFRASMVDMILEKQLFGAEDLEKLLSCFLNLNAVRYHGIIFEVFSEICEALFSY
ncbi:uncharacterized protein [Primulina huaijiensis]|uniref:uncharacterized protein n=1 Tax=Primulina huaijiensis TaxID=1492673 RepID=UPI003CC705BA